ncbi:MAG: ATP-dependent helicase PcrA, helicase / ATP-dependent helicase PcrA, partial [Candidatus Paceibacter sp.]|nr:ATP-dependent helicase PcrA, helicase / ATP-dependent helicase PcrA [Candidatus Paceibacter sp.]
LNDKQREAATHTDGPLLILAGAGAGKTKTVTYRILHLIKQGVPAKNILAITFTNKAAKEMRERIEKILAEDRELNLPISLAGQYAEKPFMSTFHSLGVHIIKENAHLLGLPRHFAIFDKSDSKRAVKEAIEEAGLDPKQFEPNKIMNAISKAKGDLETAESFTQKAGNNYFGRIVADIWRRYEAALRREKALDFDDLLLKTVLLLRNNKEVLEHYQNIWKYIHVDEYQDTNKVQYSISKLLAKKERNICVVGDIDQMIYSWRGADIQNILDFEKDYPDAKVVLLEQNYRSTQTILTAANRVIVKNKNRREKNLFTKNGEGERIGVFGGYDEADEAEFIAEKSGELIRQGVDPKEIAVLYRANFQSRVLEEAFLRNSVAYQVLGVRFFERKEVKDILSYLRAALNPDSMADMKRVINVPARGIGKVTILKIFSGQRDTLPASTKKKVDEFFTILGAIKIKAETEKPSEIIKYIIKVSGIEQSLKQANTEEDQERLENIKELVTLATKYDEENFPPTPSYKQEGENANPGVESLLADAALATDQDSLEKSQNAVKLMTIHAAKGLEFDYVFISGLEENLFPHQRMGDEKDVDMEEERRLFYVALTRARKKLFLTYAGMRTIFGSKQVNVPSEFMIEMEDDLVQAEERTGSRRGNLKTIYFD